MNRRLLLLLCLLPLLASAEIYKSIDADGNVVFSDTPRPGAKKIILPPTPVYNLGTPPQSATSVARKATANAYYTLLRIVQPAAGETVRDNTGAVAVSVGLTPPLNVQAGHKLIVALDGNTLSQQDNATQIKLSNLDRGVHTLKATVLDATGQVQISSQSLTFYMKRESVLQHTDQPAANTGSGSANNPNVLSNNPNQRSNNPNKLRDNPNVLSTNPNVIKAPPAPAGP
ncbi:MAG: DUF4124 domain-containing protein [Gammaproteobacteria bacterium]